MVVGLGVENINWDVRIDKEPTRYAVVRNKENEIVELHDLRTGEVWFKVGSNRWMRM